MITLLTGSPGHGKSYTLIRMIEQTVAGKGQPCATNVPLRPDWATIMARRHTLFGPFRKEAVARKASELERLMVISNDFDTLLRVRLSGEGEGRGKLILDESQRWMNTRGYDSALNPVTGEPVKRAVALMARMRILNHLSGHRHYGYDVVLATQSDKAIDTQARDLYEFHSEVRNMRRLPWIGMICRVNVFLLITRWNDRAKSKAGVNLYFLSKSLASLYHTHALGAVGGTDWPDEPIMLPRDPELVDGKMIKTEHSEKRLARIEAEQKGKELLAHDPLALGVVYRLSNGQLVTVGSGNKGTLPRVDEAPEARPASNGRRLASKGREPDPLVDEVRSTYME